MIGDTNTMSNNFGEVLKEARRKKGLTGKEVASISGISQSQYSKLENNKANTVSINAVGKICSLLRIDANDLFIVKPSSERFVNEYKEKLINKLDFCCKITKNADNEKTSKHMDKLNFINKSDKIEIHYCRVGLIMSKYGEEGFVMFICILYKFVSDMMELDESITCWYELYSYIVEILAKL